MGKSIKTENRFMVPVAVGRRELGVTAYWVRVFFWA